MSDDPLSDVLKLADARPLVAGGFSASGSWAMRFPPPEKIKFMAVTRGSCWFTSTDRPQPALIETGDVVFHSRQAPFLLYGDPDAEPLISVEVWGKQTSPFVQLGDGSEFSMIGGHVQVDQAFSDHLLDLIPRWLQMKGSTPGTADIRWVLEQLVAESTTNLPGAGIASSQLAQLLFIQVLRLHLAASETLAAGPFRALGDLKIAPALHLMHHQPDRPWQLEELAKAASMSRTSFAVHFKAVAGISPLAYLTTWRMQLARKRLRAGDVSVGTLADSLGYASESAFSNAFKRVTGTAPKRFRSMATAAPLPAVLENPAHLRVAGRLPTPARSP